MPRGQRRVRRCRATGLVCAAGVGEGEALPRRGGGSGTRPGGRCRWRTLCLPRERREGQHQEGGAPLRPRAASGDPPRSGTGTDHKTSSHLDCRAPFPSFRGSVSKYGKDRLNSEPKKTKQSTRRPGNVLRPGRSEPRGGKQEQNLTPPQKVPPLRDPESRRPLS